MKLQFKFTLLAVLISCFQSFAQLSGSYSIPSTIPSLAVAINSLNTLGVSGPVTINVAAGYTELAPAGGYQLYNVAGTSAINQVTFIKSGVGANPLLTAYTGTAPVNAAVQDGVWWFIGADYITVDGIDISDPNTSGNSMMEFGYGFFKASPTDGCQFNSIKHCVITLKNSNSGPVGLSLPGGSTGIWLSHLGATLANITVVPTSPAGANSYNHFYSNLIQNCHTGITAFGFTEASPYANSDYSNDVGGIMAATGNTLVNFGGGTGSPAYGLHTYSQYQLNASYNTVNNNNGSGLNPLTDLFGIRINWGPDASVAVNSNTLTLKRTGSVASQLNGIYRDAGTSGNTNTVTIEGNVIPSYGYTSTTTPAYGFLIYNGANAGYVSMQQNAISNVSIQVNTLPASPQPAFNMFTSGVVNTTCAINSNSVTSVSGTGDCLVGFIRCDGAATQLISNNYVNNATWQGAGAGHFQGILTTSSPGNYSITSNRIQNLYSCSGATLHGLYVSATGQGLKTVSNNEISNFGTSPGATGGIHFLGMYFFNNSGAFAISGNTIHSVVNSGTATASNILRGMYLHSGNATGLVFKNRIFGLTNNLTGPVLGLDLLGTYGYTVSNNLIGGLESPNTNSSTAVFGINCSIGDCKFFFNTVYLNAAVNTSTLFGSTCFSVSPSNTQWELRNNIFVNGSVATGTGITSVIVQNTSNNSNYSNASNNNLLYAGVPSASNIIYRGTSTYSTLAAFKGFAFPREVGSVTENPPFISTSGFAANYLNMTPFIPTQVESGAAPLATIPDDYIGTLRNGSTPDIGAWEGLYTGADLVPPTTVAQGFTSNDCNLTGRTLTVNISDTYGIATGTLAPRVYYKVNAGAYTSVQGLLSTGTASNGVWAFSLSYAAAVNDVISYFLAVQDAWPMNAVAITPSPGASATSVNSVSIPPTSPSSFVVNAPPAVSINSGSICLGQTFTLVPSGASSYTISGGSYTPSPASNATYTLTGTGPTGCTATAIAQIYVGPIPTIAVNNSSMCLGAGFTISPSGADTYSYSGGSAMVNPTVTTSYTITGSSYFGCAASNTVVINITVMSAPTLSVTGPATVCANTSQTLVASGALTYTWNTGGQGDSLIILASPTIQNYTVTGSGPTGCTDTAQLSLAVYPLPTLAVQGNTAICVGNAATLQVSGEPLVFFWGNGAIGTSIVVSPIVNTPYTVEGSSTNGCLNTLTVTVQVSACTGMESLILSGELKLYPNPGEHIVYVETSHAGRVELYNLVGQLLQSQAISASSKTGMDVTELPSGSYLCKFISQNNGVVTKKIQVMR